MTGEGTDELRRVAYLEAMGIDTYVSRRQLPGAAATRRLAVVAPGPVASAANPQPLGEIQSRLTQRAPRQSASGVAAMGGAERPAAREPASLNTPRFSLSAIVAGRWLWLEELGDLPLSMEQVHLVEAMASALNRASAADDAEVNVMAKPEVTQFDWPIHTNRQLALGEEAARAAVAGFLSRRLDQCQCEGLVLLGDPCVERVPADEIDVRIVRLPGSLEILARPMLKPQVWRDLMPLVRAT